MEVKIVISSLSIGFGNTGFGANAITGAYIQTRVAPGAPVNVYGIVDSLSLGSNSSTVLVGHVSTHWFRIDKSAEKILGNRDNLVGKVAQLEATGTLLMNGKTDIKLTIYDKLGKGVTVFDLINIASSGGQLSSTKVRGQFKEIIDNKIKSEIPN